MQLLWPLKNIYVTQKFGQNPKLYEPFGLAGHNGLDCRATIGTEVFASHDGFVKLEEDQGDKAYGLHLRLQGEDGSKKFETEYAHLSKTAVHKGQQVKAGQLIGLSGNSGFSTAPHLHWSVRYLDPNGNPIATGNGYKGWIDPAQYAVENLMPTPELWRLKVRSLAKSEGIVTDVDAFLKEFDGDRILAAILKSKGISI